MAQLFFLPPDVGKNKGKKVVVGQVRGGVAPKEECMYACRRPPPLHVSQWEINVEWRRFNARMTQSFKDRQQHGNMFCKSLRDPAGCI